MTRSHEYVLLLAARHKRVPGIIRKKRGNKIIHQTTIAVNREETEKKKRGWGKKTNEYALNCVNEALLKPTQQRSNPAHSLRSPACLPLVIF